MCRTMSGRTTAFQSLYYLLRFCCGCIFTGVGVSESAEYAMRMRVTMAVVFMVVVVSVVVSSGVFAVMNLVCCVAFLAVRRLCRVKPTCCHGG